jgi:hypothetical protein
MDARVRRPIVLSGVAAFLVTTVLAQAPPGQAPARDNTTPQTGTARVRGRVTTSEGAPLRRAQVRLSGAGLSETRVIASDADGRYEIRDLPAGRFTLTASKGGYLTLSFGQRRPVEPGQPLEIANGQLLDDIDFHLPVGGVIVVRVIDDLGDPFSGAEVEVRQYRYAQGLRTLSRVVGGSGSPFPETTDDVGEVRVYGLPPGEYYVAALVRVPVTVGPSDRRLSYAETYYPGTSVLADAQRVVVGIAKEVSVTFPLLATRTALIAGVVRRSDGSHPGQSSVRLVEYYGGTSVRSMGANSGPIQPDGTFRIPSVLPGDYHLETDSLRNSPNAEHASVPLKVRGEDVTNLSITTARFGEIRGRITFDVDGPQGLAPPNVMLRAHDAMATVLSAGANVRADWTFDIPALTGSRLLRLSPAMQGWYLKSVLVDARDMVDTPIDVTGGAVVSNVEVMLTRRQAEATGTAVGGDGKPVAEYAAIVFHEDPARWTPQSRFIATARSDQQGAFRIRGLPSGRYLAVAVEYLETGSERDPELLNRLRDVAQPVVLTEGESTTMKLGLGSY